MRNSPFWLIVIALMILFDFYVFQAVKTVSHSAGHRARSIIFITYWLVSLSALAVFCLLPFLNLENFSKGLRTVMFALVVGLFFAKLAAALFLLVDDIRRAVQWMASLYSSPALF